LLKSSFFKADRIPDRKSPEFWTRFSFPFWFTYLVSSLDSLSLIGFGAEDPQMRSAPDWLRERQRKDGTWDLKLLRTRDKDLRLWMSIPICRVLRRLY